MFGYLLQRLILLPLTLFLILLINFVILGFAPGEPTTVTEISQEAGALRKAGATGGGDLRYLQFREYYGLTLPVLWNSWPFLSKEEVGEQLSLFAQGPDLLGMRRYEALRLKLGDEARFIMPQLAAWMEDPALSAVAVRFFVRGGIRQAYVGASLTSDQKRENGQIAEDNRFLLAHQEPAALQAWLEKHKERYLFSFSQKVKLFFFETRFCRYFSRVLTLDFGTLRNDQNKTVLSEVGRRLKYSFTLSLIPMGITLVLSLLFGLLMAAFYGRFLDWGLNIIFLILFAIPIFVVAPFLIEKVALHHTFPFTHIPIPISGFQSTEAVFAGMSSRERLVDIVRHLALPWMALLYGGFAAQSRLARGAVLEVLRQDYVRTARAKGLSTTQIWFKHIGRNASITIVTSVAASLGAVLGGSLIIETLFDINGFGKFFYDGILNRDYNVILFSALAGSFLALVGYLIADLLYMLLDPRVSLRE